MKPINKLLVTGSAGFIGSTFCYEALKRGFEVMGMDNYSNSNKSSTEILKSYSNKFSFCELDLSTNLETLKEEFKKFQPDAVIHLAALKSVQASEEDPTLYWKNNLGSTSNVIESMHEISCKKLIFSSSASVYAAYNELPLTEDSALDPISIYGKTKLACENLIQDSCRNGKVEAVIFRYFNLSGAHKERIFLERQEYSDSLMTKLIDVAEGNRDLITIYGNKHITEDGTASRDFIHIDDLVDAHFIIFRIFNDFKGCEIFNLSTGKETSVLSLLQIFQESHKVSIQHVVGKPRKQEISRSFASSGKIFSLTGWKTKKTIEDICFDSWDLTNFNKI